MYEKKPNNKCLFVFDMEQLCIIESFITIWDYNSRISFDT